ncbi:MAG: hypothetical protein ACQESG_01230 [Nanobdellota archaeon]
MWGILKSFRKKQEPQTISIESLQDWFQELEADILDETGQIIDSYRKLIDYRQEQVYAALDRLQQASLQNPNIPHREMQIMEGNREAYAKSIRQLLDKLALPEDPCDAHRICTENIQALDEFAKDTLKQYQVLSHFFANELSTLAKHLKGLDSQFRNLQSDIEKTGLMRLESVRNDIENFFHQKQHTESLTEELFRLETDIEKAQEAFDDAKKRLEELKTEQAAQEVETLKKKAKEITSQIQGEENSMRQFFMNFQSPLKKFERVAFENEDLIHGYLTNPIRTLTKDYDLKVVRILQNLKRAVDNGSIELKEKKREKVISLIINTDDSFFQEFLTRYNQLHAKLREIEEKLESHPYISREQSLLMKYQKAEEQLDEVHERKRSVSARLEQVDLDAEKHNLEENLSRLKGNEVSIKGE